MKRKVFAALGGMLLALCLLCAALAEGALPEPVEALLREAYPAHEICEAAQCWPTAAAVLSGETGYVLCIAQERDGEWALAVASETALRQDAAPTLLLDTDISLFWRYFDGEKLEEYYAFRALETWHVVNVMQSEAHSNGNVSEHHLWLGEGRMHYTAYLCDENDNLVSTWTYEPVPAAWLEGQTALETFDVSRFPKVNTGFTHSWLGEEATAQAAQELFPGYTFLGGCADRDQLAFFLQTPDGEQVAALCRYRDVTGWQRVISAPLPAGTTYGYENFSTSFVIGGLAVNLGFVSETQGGVTSIYNPQENASGERLFTLGENWITKETPVGSGCRFGDHPWSDITAIDWHSLPQSFEAALERLHTSGWAVVHNPNPADRLHLRAKADRGSKSLGKYYNGTPVRVIQSKGDWARVSVFGVEGYMMKKYLAFGDDMHAVEAVFPHKMVVEDVSFFEVFPAPQECDPILRSEAQHQSLRVLGVVGDEWYHVWFPQEGLSGYVRQEEWWDGNG